MTPWWRYLRGRVCNLGEIKKKHEVPVRVMCVAELDYICTLKIQLRAEFGGHMSVTF